MAGEMCRKLNATRVWNRTPAMSVACRDERTKETGKPHTIRRECISNTSFSSTLCKDVVTESTKCKGAGSSFAVGRDTEGDARECADSLNQLAKGGEKFVPVMTEHNYLLPNVWKVDVKK